MPLPKLPTARRRELANQVGVGEQYLYQILRGIGVASPALARKLNAFEPLLRLQDLRPNDWNDLWPELADPKPNHHQAPAHQALVAINSEVQGVAA